MVLELASKIVLISGHIHETVATKIEKAGFWSPFFLGLVDLSDNLGDSVVGLRSGVLFLPSWQTKPRIQSIPIAGALGLRSARLSAIGCTVHSPRGSASHRHESPLA